MIKNFTSEGVIAKYRIVAAGANDGVVKQAASSTDKIIGCTGVVGVDVADKRIDVCLGDVRRIEFGGDITMGDPLTSDAQGRAVVAAPAAAANVRIIGFALEAGAIGVFGAVNVIPQTMQG